MRPTSIPKIPGFTWDPEKNRYFPSHRGNWGSNAQSSPASTASIEGGMTERSIVVKDFHTMNIGDWMQKRKQNAFDSMDNGIFARKLLRRECRIRGYNKDSEETRSVLPKSLGVGQGDPFWRLQCPSDIVRAFESRWIQRNVFEGASVSLRFEDQQCYLKINDCFESSAICARLKGEDAFVGSCQGLYFMRGAEGCVEPARKFSSTLR